MGYEIPRSSDRNGKLKVRIKELTVELRRWSNGLYAAYAVQADSEGPIFGRNMLRGIKIRTLYEARARVGQMLNGKVDKIVWRP